ncbi:MerR family transcriptional regulator [Streptomyces sp. B1866]|uniref:MerR family transcriptional regulator n=1 Tax=Streptomyces sp. B1866 TaxID=3075431 RepID=UPI00288F47F8|nr:MerR family transcriptional regulator [Streptomyces sp. B1866]MDT3398092.1 MerR family transcriptional regulator [Streptomyces sp. B1866]
MSELAEKAGISVRTLRFYRERKLIPPPRREGRIAWYNDEHLTRLHSIAALLERGHTLGGIAELLDAFESGRRDVAEFLGLDTAFGTPWSEETPVRLTPEDLADYFADQVTPESLKASLDLGYVAVDGEQIVHVSKRLLEASRSLVEFGVPLAAMMAAAREVRPHMEALADIFTTLIRTHVLTDAPDGTAGTAGEAAGGPPPWAPEPEELAEMVGEIVTYLRPLAEGVVEAELSMAMDRRVRAELRTWLGGGAYGQAADDARATEDARAAEPDAPEAEPVPDAGRGAGCVPRTGAGPEPDGARDRGGPADG